MFKKLFVSVLTVMMAASFAFGGSAADAGSVKETKETNGVSAQDKVNKYKIYTLKRADNDQLTIELWYRDGSDYVAQISGATYVPAGSTEYDGMVADNAAFAEELKAADLPDDIMHFGYDEVKLENGYVRNNFVFKELDADNADSVEMIAEFLGLPETDGYFKLSECEEYLEECEIPLEDEN